MFQHVLLTAALLLSPLVLGANESCYTLYWLKSVTPVTQTITVDVYETTSIRTRTTGTTTLSLYPSTREIHKTSTVTVTHWSTVAPTTTTIPTVANFTAVASARNASRYVSVVNCYVYVPITSPLRATTFAQATKTVIASTPLTTTHTHVTRYNFTSTIPVSTATVYDACNPDNRIEKYHDQYLFYEVFADNSEGTNLIEHCGGSLSSSEECMLVRAATKSPRACCHAIWNLYYKTESAPYAWTFSSGGGTFSDGNCLGWSGGSTNEYEFHTGPDAPSGEQAGGFYLGNGFGGIPYYGGYLTAYPGF